MGAAGCLASSLIDVWPDSLIPGLPPELALTCLARVHPALCGPLFAVSSQWKKALEGGEVQRVRLQEGRQEEVLAVGLADRLDATGVVDVRFFCPTLRVWWRAPPLRLHGSQVAPHAGLSPTSAAAHRTGPLEDYQCVAAGEQLFIGGGRFRGGMWRGGHGSNSQVWALPSPVARAWRRVGDIPEGASLGGATEDCLLVSDPARASQPGTGGCTHLLHSATGELQPLGPPFPSAAPEPSRSSASRSARTAESLPPSFSEPTFRRVTSLPRGQVHPVSSVPLSTTQEAEAWNGGRKVRGAIGSQPSGGSSYGVQQRGTPRLGVTWHHGIACHPEVGLAGVVHVVQWKPPEGEGGEAGAAEGSWVEVAQLPPRSMEQAEAEGCITVSGYLAAQLGPTLCVLHSGQTRHVPFQSDKCRYRNDAFCLHFLNTAPLAASAGQRPPPLTWEHSWIPLDSLGARVVGCAVVTM